MREEASPGQAWEASQEEGCGGGEPPRAERRLRKMDLLGESEEMSLEVRRPVGEGKPKQRHLHMWPGRYVWEWRRERMLGFRALVIPLLPMS